MVWIIIISFFIALLIWILAGPLIFFINTENHRYFVTLPGIFKAAVVPHEDFVRLRVWIFFIPITIDPLKSGKRMQRKTEQKPRKKKRFKLPSGSAGMMRRFLHAFRIRKLYVDIDTEDVLLNAWLIPAFSMINANNIRMRANFVGVLSLVLDLRTHLGALLWILISTKIKSMFNF